MTIVEVRVPGDLQARLMTDIAKKQEWAGYLLCGVARFGDRELLIGQDWVAVPAQYQIANSHHGFSWHPDFDVQMLNRIQKENLSSVVLHFHGGSSPELGMSSDRETMRTLMPFLSREAPGRPHIFGVLGDHAASGVVFQDGTEATILSSFGVSSSWLDDWTVGKTGRKLKYDARQDRMVRGFGEDAFRRLRSSSVGVIGCGGGGSHVVQQLAYLGVGSLTLVDADVIEESNLNRLVGSTTVRSRRSIADRLLRRGLGDVGHQKVEVMKRLVGSIDDSIVMRTFAEYFPSRETVKALRQCDILIACVDKLQVRDDLNRLCKRYLIPLVDVGLEITPGLKGSGAVTAITGRVSKVLADGPCLRCQGVISDQKLAAERDGLPMGYTGASRIPDPAVVTLNGIVASMAATEVLQLLTGFARDDASNCGWMYDGLRGITERVEKAFHGCFHCKPERGRGDIET